MINTNEYNDLFFEIRYQWTYSLLRRPQRPGLFQPFWKSPRGGWIGKSEIYNFKHNYKPGLALEIKLSPKERVKTNQSKK
jgi:hypothetical protein